MCAYGILVPQLPWAAIGVVWLYALAWMVVIDLVKLLYVRIQDGRDERGAGLIPADRGGAGDVNYTKKLMVEPGAKVRLAKFDPGLARQARGREAAVKELEAARTSSATCSARCTATTAIRC